MIIDGKAIAEDIYAQLAASRFLLLGVVVGASNPVTDSFVRIKEKAAGRLGISLVRTELPGNATTEDAIAAVAALSQRSDGIIVQLPLPNSIDVEAVLATIPPEKDVDGISSDPRVLPPVAGAVEEILAQQSIDPRGKYVLIVGHGRLVGKPVAKMLRERGATVVVAEDSINVNTHAPKADIVVLGAGQPGLLRPEYIKEGVVIIDAGTSEVGGKVAGDADPACAAKASVFTPVPGGVGPIAVAMIFKNLSELANQVAPR